MPTASASTTAPKPAKKKIITTRVGLVDSDKRDKTRKVIVEILSMHHKYGKIVRGRTILHVHDEKNESHFGDLVEVAPCPPVSKTKRWALVKVIQKGVGMKFEGVDAPSTDKDGEVKAAPAKSPAAKSSATKAAPAKGAVKKKK